MKRITLSFVALALTILTANAQFKKSWDFTKGLSDETIANLKADGSHWAENGNDADGNVNNWKNVGKPATDSYLTANGTVIPELEGLYFDIGSNKDNSIHIATTKLRLTRKGTKITFPKLANGQKITFVGRSANSTATNRGIAPVQDYIQFVEGEQTDGQSIFIGGGVEGSLGTYTFVYQVVTESTDSVDVQFQLTPDAGIDFTLFQIDEGDAPEVEEAKNVAYIYSGEDPSIDDYAYIYVSSLDGVTPTIIKGSDEITLDSLQAYDLVVVSPTVQPTDAIVPVLKSAIAYEPMLNLNASLYPAWGLGAAVESTTGIATVSNAELPLFENIDLSEGFEMLQGANITGVTLGDYFANDDIIATADDIVAIHMHNPARNAYLLLPYSVSDLLMANQDNLAQILTNAIPFLAETKKEVTQLGGPSIRQENENGKTTVSISSSNKTAVIYYTIDGTEPTTSSTVYTEPFTLTQAATLKAFATADGYLPSAVVTAEIAIFSQAEEPGIEVAQNGAETTVTLTSPEGTSIYYNFVGNANAATSTPYTEPIVLTEPTYIYAFTTGENLLNSELASRYVAIATLNAQTIRLDTLAHFDASVEPWFVDGTEHADSLGNGKNSAYYFWGKNAWNYYSEEIDHEETVTGSEGQDSIVYYYKPDPTAIRYIYPLTDTPWRLKSQGQVLTGELTLAPEYAVGNGATGRYAETAQDNIGNPSKGVITFGAKTSGEPYTAAIETTQKFAGPFDVVVYVGNGNGSGAGILEIQTSADGENWESIGELTLATTQRYWKKNRAAYEGTDEVFVRVAQTGGGTKAQVYDVLLFNNGELSKAYDPVIYEGIVSTTANAEVIATEVFTIDGMRLAQPRNGINIIRQRLSNGTTTTSKILVK